MTAAKVKEPEVAPLPTVHRAIAAVIAELPAIGKGSTMKGGGPSYQYRGIEAVKAELKPLLGRHGVHYAPELITDMSDAVETVNGKPWQRIRLMVGFRIYGPDGSSIPAVGRGEGFDNSDKANNKAMTMAEKQMLIQVFCVADGDADPDHERPERGDTQQAPEQAPEPRPAAPINGVKVAISKAIGKDEAEMWWKEFGVEGVTEVPAEQADQMVAEATAWAHNPAKDEPPADALVEGGETDGA